MIQHEHVNFNQNVIVIVLFKTKLINRLGLKSRLVPFPVAVLDVGT